VENYFNYFTEIEECFRRCRGTPTLLSTLDWALVESWKEGGIPLAAALAGIEHSFQKFAKRPQRFRKINGLAYCSQAVLEAAQQVAAAGVEGGSPPGRDARAAAAPFTAEEISNYLHRNAQALEQAARQARENRQAVLADDLAAAAAALEESTGPESEKAGADFEELERRLSAFEEKLTASLTRAASVELLAQFRREVEQGLVRYRSKMTAAQIESLERQFLKKRLFELYQIPRLSLFYL
jgi:hypothetical protein